MRRKLLQIIPNARQSGQKSHSLHLRYAGDNDELDFRDYLNEHTDVAREHEAFKLRLWKKYEHNSDAYTEVRSKFIQHWTQV